MEATRRAAPDVRTLCAVLLTPLPEGELLEVTPERVDLTGGRLVFRTLNSCSAPSRSAVRASTGPFPSPGHPSTMLTLVHRVRKTQNIAGAYGGRAQRCPCRRERVLAWQLVDAAFLSMQGKEPSTLVQGCYDLIGRLGR
jgi:hypothetical protein